MTVLDIKRAPETADASAAPTATPAAPAVREVRHEYSRAFPPLLNQLGVSLLVSTYQAGKVVAVGVARDELTLSYHNFERAMGLAVKLDGIAVGARGSRVLAAGLSADGDWWENGVKGHRKRR